MKRLSRFTTLALLLLGCRSGAPALSPMPRLEKAPPHATGRESWTSDRSEFAVGDVLLVLIDELTVADASSQNHASDSRSHNLTAQLAAALKDNSLGSANVGISSAKAAESQRSGDASRRNHFSSEMSVRVVGFSSTGQLYVRGQKIVLIDNHQQAIQLGGWVRAQDVTSQNTVLSSRIGDAEIVYAGNGSLEQTPAGLLTRMAGALWP